MQKMTSSAQQQIPLSPSRSPASMSPTSMSPTFRRSNTRTGGGGGGGGMIASRRHSTLAEGRSRRPSVQAVDLMDLSLPDNHNHPYLPGAQDSTATPSGLSTSRDSMMATADMINMLSTFQSSSNGGMNASLSHFSVASGGSGGGGGRRNSAITRPSWMYKQSSLNNMSMSENLMGEVNLMDMSAPAHYSSMAGSGGGTRRGSIGITPAAGSTRRQSISTTTASSAATAVADTLTSTATNVVNLISDTVGQVTTGSSHGSTSANYGTGSGMADILKQRRAFQRSGTVDSEDLKQTQELVRLRASVAEKDIQIEALIKQLEDAHHTIKEETQSNIDLEDDSSDELDDTEREDIDVSAHRTADNMDHASAHHRTDIMNISAATHSSRRSHNNPSFMDEQSELRQSMRTRMSSAAYSSKEPYIPSAWQTPEEFRKQHMDMETKLATAIADQESTQQFLKEREKQITCLQREMERQLESERKLKAKLRNMEKSQVEQIEKLKQASLKALEEEQASSEKQLRKQAKQFQKRAEKAVAILDEMHMKDKEEITQELHNKIKLLESQLQLQQQQQHGQDGTTNGVVSATTTTSVAEAGAAPVVGPKEEEETTKNRESQEQQEGQGTRSQELAQLKKQLEAQTLEMEKRDQVAQKKLAAMEKKLKQQEQSIQKRVQQFVQQHQTKLQQQTQQLQQLQKSDTKAKQEKAALQEKLDNANKELELLKKQQQQQQQSSVRSLVQQATPASPVPVPPSPTTTTMGEKIRERMQEQARMLDRLRQTRTKPSIEL